MSADNWTRCPACKRKDEEHSQELWTAMGAAYGTVSPERYMEMRDEAQRFDALEKPRTLREDYSVGIDGRGYFTLDYRCSCNDCDFQFEHKVEIDDEGIAAWQAAHRPSRIEIAAKQLARLRRRRA